MSTTPNAIPCTIPTKLPRLKCQPCSKGSPPATESNSPEHMEQTNQKPNNMETNINELEVNGVKYVRKDSVSGAVRDIGEKRIIVADRGWIFVGNCQDNEDGSVTIRNARNIRQWGTTQGLGQLKNGPTATTKHDDYGEVRCVPIIQINVLTGW